MILDLDCVRDILLAIEKRPMGELWKLDRLCAELPNYDKDSLWYSCLELNDARILNVLTTQTFDDPIPCVVDIKEITPYGHRFLDSIRNQNIWGKIKTAAAKVGAVSLPVLLDLAKDIFDKAILSQF